MAPATADNPEETWLLAAEAELTALAEEAEKVERMPDALLKCPPPPGGVDLITPDPRWEDARNRNTRLSQNMSGVNHGGTLSHDGGQRLSS